MPLFFRRFSQVNTILALRSVAIFIQIALILFVNLALNYQLPWLPLIVVMTLEIVFTIVSYLYYNTGRLADRNAILIQVCADILFLTLLLYFTGGATNAFVSLLLIPISIAAVTLTPLLLGAVALLAIGSYSILLWLLPMSVMHGNMEGHFIAMWINFLFSAVVVATVVGKMARRINQRELALSVYREEQLKQEKVIALGVASAQVTHQLATPMSTVQLLADELKEDLPDNQIVDEMLSELNRCRESLESFRQMVFDIKQQTRYELSCLHITEQIKEHLTINYPEINVEENMLCSKLQMQESVIVSDASLLPAILNLVHNAIRATKSNGHHTIVLSHDIKDSQWRLMIRDLGLGFTIAELADLGAKPVTSEQGLGMAVLLSHASLERLGGKLKLANHQDGGAQVTLALPLKTYR